MRKAPIVITATAAGLAGVLGFHTRKLDVTIPSGGASGGSAGAASGPASGSPAAGSHASSAGGSGQAARAAASAGRPAPAKRGTSGAGRSATGKLVPYGYGELSVRVKARGNRIVDVSIAQIQVADSYSAQLAQYVVPTLRSEVLHLQSANIQGISGATYTSYAYQASLQSALDKLHLR
jgi:uncharacterized protein with FMN-binding domain